MERRLWSQVVAVALGSARQRGRSLVAVRAIDSASNPVAGPLSCGFGARREGFEPPTARSVVWGRPQT
jgi:hypothetical protein